MFADTPARPYYAVIFPSRRRDGDDGYDAMAEIERAYGYGMGEQDD